MHVIGLGHIRLFGRFQKSSKVFYRCVPVMMATAAGIGLLVHTAGFYAGLRIHEPESMAVGVTRLPNARHSGHVTTDATAKGVDPVDRAVLGCRMAALAKLVFEQSGLGTDNE